MTQPFQASTRGLSYVLAAIGAALLLKAGYIQIVRADAVAGTGALAVQADGERRYEYNPRLLAIAHSIPRGTIYDRNGLPLATSNWDEIANHRDAYAKAGIPLEIMPIPARPAFIRSGPKRSTCLEICEHAPTGPPTTVRWRNATLWSRCKDSMIVQP